MSYTLYIGDYKGTDFITICCLLTDDNKPCKYYYVTGNNWIDCATELLNRFICDTETKELLVISTSKILSKIETLSVSEININTFCCDRYRDWMYEVEKLNTLAFINNIRTQTCAIGITINSYDIEI